MAVMHVLGRLGSGKTMFAVQKIVDALISGKEVHTNIRLVDYWAYHISLMLPIRNMLRFVKAPYSDYQLHCRYELMKIQELYHYHKSLKDFIEDDSIEVECLESSRLLVWDEMHLELNSRDWKTENKKVVRFFTLSRKMGFDIYIISQLQAAVDKQLRELADCSYEIKNLNRFIPFLNFGMLVKRWQNSSRSSQGVWKGLTIVTYKTNVIRNLYNTRSLLREDAPRSMPMKHEMLRKSCKFRDFYIREKSETYQPDTTSTECVGAGS